MKERKSLLNLAKENIYHLYPKVSSIDIHMTRLANGHFKSKIIIKIKAKIFFANREGKNYKESLDKSFKAIKKQLERVKIDKVHKSKKESIIENEIKELYYTDTGGES